MIAAGSSLKIVDVRSPGEFALGHIPGAVNQPLETVGDPVALAEGERL
ncbi:rhodanese-like domain-containing protein, partial [Acinetobacter baumannii]